MSDKRQLLITTAFKLFYLKGVHAVGINEILNESGVAKKTLYHHFSGKEALVSAVLEYRDQNFYNWLNDRLNSTAPGQARIHTLFNALDDWFNDKVDRLLPFHGCFFINVSGEYSDQDHSLHRQCHQHKENISQLIRDQVETLNFCPQQTEEITAALCLLKEGAITLAHVQGDKQAAIKALSTAKLLLAQAEKSSSPA